MSLFSSRETVVSLILHIESSSVGVSVVQLSSGASKSLPEILFTHRESFETSAGDSYDTREEKMYTALDTTLSYISAKGLSEIHKTRGNMKINSFWIIFSLPWYTSRTKHIHVENQKPFVISKAFIDDVLKKEFEIFEHELHFSLQNKKTYSIVENNLINSQVNGYTLENSIGKKTKIFDAYIFQSTVTKSLEDRIRDKAFSVLHIHPKNTKISTFPFVLENVVHTISLLDYTFVTMFVSAELTELTLVRDNVILKTVSFSHGYNSVVRYIAKSLSLPFQIAESMLHLYTKEDLNPESGVPFDEIMRNIHTEWSIYFEDSIKELIPEAGLPSKLFLITESNVSMLYSHFIQIQKNSGLSLFLKDCEAVSIHSETLSKYIMCTRSDFYDIALICSAIHVQKVSE